MVVLILHDDNLFLTRGSPPAVSLPKSFFVSPLHGCAQDSFAYCTLEGKVIKSSDVRCRALGIGYGSPKAGETHMSLPEQGHEEGC